LRPKDGTGRSSTWRNRIPLEGRQMPIEPW